MTRSAFDVVLDYLSFGARTESEIREYLQKKKYKPETIKETLKKLVYYHYIDDEAYTRRAIEENAFTKRFGRKRLKVQLSKKGISDELLPLVDELVSEEDESDFIEYHFEKVSKKTENLIYKKRVNRISAYLIRRGFNYSQFASRLQDLPKETEIDEEEFFKHLEHYKKMYTKKGYTGRDLKNRIIKAMASRGYHYDDVKIHLEEE